MHAIAGKNWTCRHCGCPQTLTPAQIGNRDLLFDSEATSSKYGTFKLSSQAIACANDDCKELTLEVWLNTNRTHAKVGPGWHFTFLSRHRLRPRSSARQWPAYVPVAIREDYEEACLVADLSPKAAATLARRCMQGMIRDFCGIAEKTLNREIQELEKRVKSGSAPRGVQEEHIDAIDAIRSVGNIGAHMEEDVNVIVAVDEDEAKLLIALIEQLVDEWYVARHKRSELLKATVQLAAKKKEAKQTGAAAPATALPAPPKPNERSN